jgi:hypothetical protein
MHEHGTFRHRIILAVGLTTICAAGCCRYPKPPKFESVGAPPPLESVTIAAYGDTRTGPFGLGDNAKQAIHGMVVTDILTHDQARKGQLDAVIFTGDAVMTNFILWKKLYWRCFFSQADRFHAEGIHFYPSLGNHEVLPGFVPAFKVQEEPARTVDRPNVSPETVLRTVATEYDRGEEPTPAPEREESAPSPEQFVPSASQGSELNINNREGHRVLKQWEGETSRGSLEAAYKFGQFEHNLQQTFYKKSADDRCDLDAMTFHDDYLRFARYGYLIQLAQGRSYYAKVVHRGSIQVKLIALDTNCLDSDSQQQFFVRETKGFPGPIIVFGHHPPVNYRAPEGWGWDKVPGWGKEDTDPLKSYFSSAAGRNIVLWIFGHVHDSQRRDSNGAASTAEAPVLLIAGGGGASLDAKAPGFQWQPVSWPMGSAYAAYSQVKITVTATYIAVETRGSSSGSNTFQQLDSFRIPFNVASVTQ